MKILNRIGIFLWSSCGKWLIRNLLVRILLLGGLGLTAVPLAMADVCDVRLPAALRSNALLWQIQRKGELASYLFGTLHVEGAWVELLIKDMQPVFDATQSLLMELDMEKLSELEMAQSMLLPEPYRLSDFFSAEEFKLIERVMRGRIETSRLRVVKPWVVFVEMYSVRIRSQNADQTMDLLIASTYRQAKKPIDALETLARQLSIFDTLNFEQQAALVRRALAIYQGQSATLSQQLFRYYRRGDLINLWVLQEQFADAMGPIFTPLSQATLGDRNHDMLERIVASTSQASQMIAVGALHLPGPDGLLCLLEAQGYRINPVSLNQRRTAAK